MKKNFLYTIITLFLLTACEKEQVIPIEDYLILQTKTISVSENGGTFDIYYRSIPKEVTYSIPEDSRWITPATESKSNSNDIYIRGSLTFNAQIGSETESKQGYIFVKSGEDTDTVTVIQKMREFVRFDESEVSIPEEGGEIVINIYHNVNFTLSIDQESDWLKLVSIEDKNENHDYSILTLKGDIGSVESDRTGYVHFLYGNKKETLTVTQGQLESLVVDPSLAQIDFRGGIINATLSHNIPYNITIPEDINWVRRGAAQSGEFITETISFEIDPNETSSSRECTITFSSEDEKLNGILQIIQSGITEHYVNFIECTTPGWYSNATDNKFEIKYERFISQYGYNEQNGTCSFRIFSGNNFFIAYGYNNDVEEQELYNLTIRQNYIETDYPSQQEYSVEKVSSEEGLIWFYDHIGQQGIIVKNK